jgi:predicted phosphate transport protein (TIGR00153 family)
MPIFTRTTRDLIIKMDDFFDNIDLGLIVFREAIKAYLDKDMDSFNRHREKIDALEKNADRLQRSIENEMITHSILPRHRVEVATLIDEMDEIIDALKSTLNSISIELPQIPVSLKRNFISLTEASVNAGEELVPAARAFFIAPVTVREKLLKVYYFESETDKVGFNTKKIIFQDMKELDLAQKAQLRYIIQHIENISDLAQKAADLLSGMAIKMIL